jgi:hypothetical protein
VNGVSVLHLGPISLPFWLIFIVVAASRFALNVLAVKKGMMPMKQKLTVLFTFTGFAEMVWDIGTKVIGAVLAVQHSVLRKIIRPGQARSKCFGSLRSAIDVTRAETYGVLKPCGCQQVYSIRRR